VLNDGFPLELSLFELCLSPVQSQTLVQRLATLFKVSFRMRLLQLTCVSTVTVLFICNSQVSIENSIPDLDVVSHNRDAALQARLHFFEL
jgi:hypothetical protein